MSRKNKNLSNPIFTYNEINRAIINYENKNELNKLFPKKNVDVDKQKLVPTQQY